MKKLLILVSALALVFTSCSSESSSRSSTAPILLTKTIETYEDNSTFTTLYEYSGNKIVKLTDDEGHFDFTYNGDLITEVKYYESNTLAQTETYTYDSNGRVVEYIIVDNIDTDFGDRETYTYNSDGTISVTSYIGDAYSQTQQDGSSVISFINNEVALISFSDGHTIAYSYDNKNNPMKNIIGLQNISFCFGEASGVLHNITETDDSDNFLDATISYIYNNNDFPSSSSENFDDEVITTEYFYNQ